MKVKFNIDENFPEEKAEFWLKKMTDKISRIAQELNAQQDFLWGYREGDAFPIKWTEIYLIEVVNDKTLIYTKDEKYFYKGRLYQVQKLLPYDFITASRSAVINYQKLDHLKILDNGNIDAVMQNQINVQISRRRIKELKERLGI